MDTGDFDKNEDVHKKWTLHESLTNCGVDPHSVIEPLNINESPQVNCDKSLSKQEKLKKYLKNLPCFSLVPSFGLFPEKYNQQNFALHYLCKMQQCLQSASCLDSGDLEYLTKYLSPLQLSRFKEVSLFPLRFTIWISVIGLICAYNAFLVLAARSPKLCYGKAARKFFGITPQCSSLSRLVQENYYLLGSFFLLVLFTIRVLILYSVKREFRTALGEFSSLVKVSDDLRTLMKKSVRFIQQIELISRHYTEDNKAIPIGRIEKNSLFNSQRQCPDLRREVFLIARNTMLPLKHATYYFLQNPSSREIMGYNMRYLATVPLEDYGPCVCLGDSDECLVELFKITDSFSIASIQAIVQLYELQLAEFLKILMISSLSDPADKMGAFKCVRKIARNIEDPLKIVNDHLNKLNSVYNREKAAHLCGNESAPKSIGENNSELDKFYKSLHSLELHTRETWRRSHEIREEVEGQLNKSGGDMNEKNQEWQMKLEEILKSVSACSNSMAKCSSELALIQGENITPKNLPVAITANVKQPGNMSAVDRMPALPESETLNVSGEWAHPGVDNLPGSSSNDLFDEDVFEAYVEHENIDKESHGRLSPVEWDELKKKREDCVNVMRELKSITAGIRIDKEKREESIVQRKYRGETSAAVRQLTGSQEKHEKVIEVTEITTRRLSGSSELPQAPRVSGSSELPHTPRVSGSSALPHAPHASMVSSGKKPIITFATSKDERNEMSRDTSARYNTITENEQHDLLPTGRTRASNPAFVAETGAYDYKPLSDLGNDGYEPNFEDDTEDIRPNRLHDTNDYEAISRDDKHVVRVIGTDNANDYRVISADDERGVKVIAIDDTNDYKSLTMDDQNSYKLRDSGRPVTTDDSSSYIAVHSGIVDKLSSSDRTRGHEPNNTVVLNGSPQDTAVDGNSPEYVVQSKAQKLNAPVETVIRKPTTMVRGARPVDTGGTRRRGSAFETGRPSTAPPTTADLSMPTAIIDDEKYGPDITVSVDGFKPLPTRDSDPLGPPVVREESRETLGEVFRKHALGFDEARHMKDTRSDLHAKYQGKHRTNFPPANNQLAPSTTQNPKTAPRKNKHRPQSPYSKSNYSESPTLINKLIPQAYYYSNSHNPDTSHCVGNSYQAIPRIDSIEPVSDSLSMLDISVSDEMYHRTSDPVRQMVPEPLALNSDHKPRGETRVIDSSSNDDFLISRSHLPFIPDSRKRTTPPYGKPGSNINRNSSKNDSPEPSRRSSHLSFSHMYFSTIASQVAALSASNKNNEDVFEDSTDDIDCDTRDGN